MRFSRAENRSNGRDAAGGANGGGDNNRWSDGIEGF